MEDQLRSFGHQWELNLVYRVGHLMVVVMHPVEEEDQRRFVIPRVYIEVTAVDDPVLANVIEDPVVTVVWVAPGSEASERKDRDEHNPEHGAVLGERHDEPRRGETVRRC